MKVSIIGTGYVGLVTGVALAATGHRVRCVGRNQAKVNSINAGTAPFYEPGLDDKLGHVLSVNRLSASTDIRKSVSDSEITIIAVGTPTIDGAIDVTQLTEAVGQVAAAIADKRVYHVVAVKSTVVPGTTESVVMPILTKSSGKSADQLGICMNPEFLREGSALEDALQPDRIVIGSYDARSARMYAKLFSKNTCPIIYTNLPTAEMSKYVANTVLATLISFSNEIGSLSSHVPGVDVVDVWRIVHADNRWNPAGKGKRVTAGIVNYLTSGCGYGGSCLPKDTKALLHFAGQKGISMPMLKSTITINDHQPHEVVALLFDTIGGIIGKRIAVLGLTFKPGTDDIRESPAITVIRELVKRGAEVVCHDPQVPASKAPEELHALHVSVTKTYGDALEHADAAVLMTHWEVYTKIPPEEFLRRMNTPIVLDGRRVYDPDTFIRAGIRYAGIGRAR